MNLVFIPRNTSSNSNESLLRFALASEPVAGVVLDGLSGCLCTEEGSPPNPEDGERLYVGKTAYAIPEEWSVGPHTLRDPNQTREQRFPCAQPQIVRYGQNVIIPSEHESASRHDGQKELRFVLSNGRFATKIDTSLLGRVLRSVEADVVVLNADPKLMGEREEVRLTVEGKVAAFHRVYADSAEFAFSSTDWPHYLFIKSCILIN